ncbi:MAG TPA: prepilin-type N-terminal cleavage/methylation domain-containing protein [Luteolibacter sp.]|nr:prepilin-type N-terminal cleavage/methylation domain-containing protein [Luteolibacter sp.]
MMTSAARTSERGFSLLEMVIVMVIAALVIGGAAGAMLYSSEDQAIKRAAGELGALAKRARAAAVLKQTPYALVLRPGLVELMPLAEALGKPEDEKAREEDRWVQPMGEQESAAPQAVHWQLTLDNGMKAEVRRWGSQVWAEPDPQEPMIWRFDPNGLSEPVSLRLFLGKSSTQMDFHPLSASYRMPEPVTAP